MNIWALAYIFANDFPERLQQLALCSVLYESVQFPEFSFFFHLYYLIGFLKSILLVLISLIINEPSY